MPYNIAGVSIPKPHHWRPSHLTIAFILFLLVFLFNEVIHKYVWKGLGK